MWEESLALRKRAGGQAYGPFWVLRQGSLALSIKQIFVSFFPPDFKHIFSSYQDNSICFENEKKIKKCAQKGELPGWGLWLVGLPAFPTCGSVSPLASAPILHPHLRGAHTVLPNN